MSTTAWGVAAAAAGSAVALTRAVVRHHYESRFARRHAVGPDGIIPGAHTIDRPAAGPRALLLLHGFNDTPQAVAPVADAFAAAGWAVRAPLLPGHGRTLQAFGGAGRREWLAEAEAQLRALRARHPVVFVGGLSMGGALAVRCAARDPGVRGVLLVAPLLEVPPTLRRALRVWMLGQLLFPYVSGGGARSVLDPEARERMIAYRCATVPLLRELRALVREARAALPALTAPVWYAQSRDDNRLTALGATRAFRHLGATDKTLHWVQGAGHVLTVDHGHAALAARAVAWAEARAGAPGSTPDGAPTRG